MKFLKSNLYYFIFIIIFFIAVWILDQKLNNSKIDEIENNLGLTVAITKGVSHANTTCHIVYEYKVNGSLYRGQSVCLKGEEKCKKFLLAYSEKDPTIAVILFDFHLENNITLGSNLIEMKTNLNKEILRKWIKKQPTYIDKLYITYSSKREPRRKICD